MERNDGAVYIVSAVRSPIGSHLGSLASLRAPELGAAAVKAALARSGVPASEVKELVYGNVLQAGVGQAPARQVALLAGLPQSVVCTTLNKVCASGTKALITAALAIRAGSADICVAGGMESMSNAPYYLPSARAGMRLGNSVCVDGAIRDGLWCSTGDTHMGVCAELCAKEHGVSRAEQDAFAAESHRRASAAAAAGWFSAETVAVSVPQKRGPPKVVATDEGLGKGGDAAALAKLAPVFQKTGGSVTAGNSSGLSDGAAALVLASGDAVRRLGLRPIGVLRGFGEAACEPERFTTAPSLAVPIALAAAGLRPEDISLYEINEAFAVVSLANNKLLNLDPAKVNVCGGAVALGHPIGCSGARIVVTLLHQLARTGGRFGVAAICNGGGGASAVVVENIRAQPLSKL